MKKIYLIVFFLFLILAYFIQNNNSYFSEKLARTIAKKANCVGFEEYNVTKKPYESFMCQKRAFKEQYEHNFFNIVVFNDEISKKNMLYDLKNEKVPFKEGINYIIIKFDNEGVNESFEKKMQDYESFPDDITEPLSTLELFF